MTTRQIEQTAYDAGEALPFVDSRIYADREIFEEELDRIWKKVWLVTVHESELPEKYRNPDIPWDLDGSVRERIDVPVPSQIAAHNKSQQARRRASMEGTEKQDACRVPPASGGSRDSGVSGDHEEAPSRRVQCSVPALDTT